MAKYDKTNKYWLKLKEDWFDDDAIKWLEEQPNGKEYVLFYLKLMLKSIKKKGILIRNVGEIYIPYVPETLAELTRTDVDTVVVAMELLKRIGLVKILEDGAIYIEQVENMTGTITVGAEKKANLRELANNQMANNKTLITLNNLPKLKNCTRIDKNTIILPTGERRVVDEKRYGGNAGLVYDLTNGRCEDCGEIGELIHHENGFSNEIEDLVCLCKKCHGLHHKHNYIAKKYYKGT